MGIRKPQVLRGSILILLIAVMVLLSVEFAAAEEYGYTTESFQVDVTVGEDNSYTFEEIITVDFQDEKHGLYRYIPLYLSDGVNVVIDQVSVDDWYFTDDEVYSIEGRDDKEGVWQLIRTGMSSKTYTGEQKFVFRYRLKMVDNYRRDGDLLYVNLIPTEWETPIKSCRMKVHLPEKLQPVSLESLEVYAAEYGSDETHPWTRWHYDEAEHTLIVEGADLPKGTGITVYCPLEEGVWENPLSYFWTVPVSCIAAFGVPVLVILLWAVFGRERKITPSETCSPPEGFTPAEVGYMIDGVIDQSDMVAMVGYFAEKGYLEIRQYKRWHFELVKLREIDPSEKDFAKSMFDALFSGLRLKEDEDGRLVMKVCDLGQDFQQNFKEAYQQLKSAMSIYHPVSKISKILTVIGIMMMLAMVFGVSWLENTFLLSNGIHFLGGLVALVLFIAVETLIITERKKYVIEDSEKNGNTIVGYLILLAGSGAHGFFFYWMMGSVIPCLTDSEILIGLVPLAAAAAAAAMCLAGCTAAVHLSKHTNQSGSYISELTGFMEFLKKPDLEKLEQMNRENPNLFIQLLPYAFVLGLEKIWAEHFAEQELLQAKERAYDMNKYREEFADNIHVGMVVTDIETDAVNRVFRTRSGGGGGFSGGGIGGGGGGAW